MLVELRRLPQDPVFAPGNLLQVLPGAARSRFWYWYYQSRYWVSVLFSLAREAPGRGKPNLLYSNLLWVLVLVDD